MGFKSIHQWVNEEDDDKIVSNESLIVLYPGGFKPLTGGHLSLIKKYTDNERVSQLKLLIGPGIRDGIDQNIAFEIATILLSDNQKVQIEKVDPALMSPLRTAYEYVLHAPPGIYALASSNKGDDYKRVLDFVKSLTKGGKYFEKLPENVSVEELSIDINPLYYKGRTDEKENTPISASVLRADLKKLLNCEQGECVDYETNLGNFTTNYPGINRDKIDQILDLLKKHMRTISESYDIFEGGGAGHMKNIWEAKNLTFKDLKKIVSDGLESKIENISEKLDGQNLMCSFKDNKIIAARNKGHLKNYGESALDIEGMKQFFGGRGSIETAFVNAMTDLQSALKLSKVDVNKIFQNGKVWLNMEIIFPDTENVIPYGTAQLRMHHFREIDQNGDLLNVSKDNLQELYDAIQKSKTFQKSERTFLIAPTNTLIIKTIQNSNKIKEQLITFLNRIEPNEDITIQDYVNTKLTEYIVNAGLNVGDAVITGFVKRWGEDDKSISINKLLQGVEEPEDIAWFKNADKNIDKVLKNIIRPIETIILKFGSTVLLNLDGLASSNPTETSKKIRDKVLKAIDDLYKYVEQMKTESIEIANKALDFLTNQLERLQIGGGMDYIAPTEGIVFDYKGNLLKITGNFGPVNQLIGYLKYER
jgi:hypothetical protein